MFRIPDVQGDAGPPLAAESVPALLSAVGREVLLLMQLRDIVDFWSIQHRNERGQWVHPDDDHVFQTTRHSFNLDFPVSPFVGNILDAEIIILGANAGYRADLTPREFEGQGVAEAYLQRTRDPRQADWSFVSRYYNETNYGHLLARGEAALVNACAYRSPKITQEPDNKKVVAMLPSAQFTRRWLLKVLLPSAASGERLVVAKRPGLWRLPIAAKSSAGLVIDPAPISPRLTGRAWQSTQDRLATKRNSG